MQCIAPYLSNLVDGLDSYPQAQCKASVIRSCLPAVDLDALKKRLPQGMEAFLDTLPPNSVWVPEVKAQVIFLGIMEVLGHEGFLTSVQTTNRALFSSPLYRTLFSVFSAKRSLRVVRAGWERFHKGSTLSVVSVKERSVGLLITAPKNLFVPTIMRAFSMGATIAPKWAERKTPASLKAR